MGDYFTHSICTDRMQRDRSSGDPSIEPSIHQGGVSFSRLVVSIADSIPDLLLHHEPVECNMSYLKSLPVRRGEHDDLLFSPAPKSNSDLEKMYRRGSVLHI